MRPVSTVNTGIWASHTQFYVVDAGRDHWGDELWDGRALERHFDAKDGIVAVGTVGYCNVPVCVELWEGQPPRELTGWDHVVEGSLEVRSGRIGLEAPEGDGVVSPLDVEPGWYRIRASAGGLDDADEMEGGDRYLVQLWPARAGDPEVLKWWLPWDPSSVVARPTTTAGRVFVGAEADDRRRRMSWLASRGSAHLFRDGSGALWEHSNLHDRSGTPQLEELSVAEAESRYGPRSGWAPAAPSRPSVRAMVRNVVQTVRYQRGQRPAPEPEEVVVDGRRVLLGGQAITRTHALRWLGSVGGDNLHVDDDGCFWEWRNEDAAAGTPRLRELTGEEARLKYGVEG